MHQNENPEPVVGDRIAGDHPLLSRRGLFKLSLVGGGALILGPGLLAACSSADPAPGGNSDPTQPATSGAGGAGADQSAGAGGAGGGAGGGGGELKVGVVSDISNFDPYYNGTVNFILMQNMNTFLIDYDDKLKPLPSGLTKWEFNDDGTQVTLTLQEGIKMQGGEVWTSADLIQGFERAADPDQGQQLNGPMAIVKDYKATDDHTVVLTFNTAVAELLVTDLLENFPITNKDHNSAEFFATKADGAGPFELKDRDPGNTVTLSRFADYWDASAVGLDTLTFRIFDNADSMVAALQSGALDVIYRFPAKNAAQLKDQFTIVEGYPGALVDCIRLNPNVAPFDKLEMRQAISRSINRERIVQEVYFGYGEPSYLPWGPNSPANDPAYEQKNSFDLDEAKKLWQAAGSPASGETLVASDNANALQELQIIQQDLKTIGFDLQIKSMDSATYTKAVLAGEFGMVSSGLGNTSKSPSRIATNSIYRTKDNPVLKDKLPKEYVDAIAATEVATTPDAVKASYDKLNEVIFTQAFGIAICTNVSLIATSKAVTGVTRDVDDRLILKSAKKSV